MKLKNAKFDNFQFIIGNLLRCPDLQKVTHGFALMYRLIEFYEFETSRQDMTIECTYFDLSSQMGVTDRMIAKSIDQLCELGLIQKKKKVSKTEFKIMPKVVERYWMKTSEFKSMIASPTNADYTKNTTIENTENTTIKNTENTTIDILKTQQSYIYETNETNNETKENYAKEKQSPKSDAWMLIENKMKMKDGRLVADFQDAPVDWANRNDGTCYSLLDVTVHDKERSRLNVISKQIALSFFTDQHKAMYRENFRGGKLSQEQKDALGSMAKDQDRKIFITGSAGSGKTHLMVGLLKQIVASRHFANRLHGVGRFFYGTLDQLDRWRRSEYEKAKAESKTIPNMSDLLKKFDVICIDDFSASRVNASLEITIDQFVDAVNSFNGSVILASRSDLNGLPIPSQPKSDLNQFKACFRNTTINLQK